MTEHIELYTGEHLPSIGLGTWKIPNRNCAQIVEDAASAGYRHFDCACDYGNEVEVGQGLQKLLSSGQYSRDDLWVTSKLWNTYHRKEHVELACQKSLSDLGLDYLDLYLIHFPISQKFVPMENRYPPGWFFDPDADEPKMEFDPIPIAETWAAMESLQEAGLVRYIGVCNFNTALLRDLFSYARVPPAVLQVESHPYLTQEKLLRFCQQNSIAYTAFSPFGALSYHEIGMSQASDSLLQHKAIQSIAEAHHRTPAQILLRWGVQRGTAVIPKTSKPERLIENISLFDFELNSDEMNTISRLNYNRRYNDPGVFCEVAFNTFCPIYD